MDFRLTETKEGSTLFPLGLHYTLLLCIFHSSLFELSFNLFQDPILFW